MAAGNKRQLRFVNVVLFSVSAVATLASGPKCAADLVLVTGNWSFTVEPGPFDGGLGGQSFTGSTSFTYDLSLIIGVGYERLLNIPLTSFSQTPAIGGTTFTTANTTADIDFIDGEVGVTYVGGAPGGSLSIEFLTDDFYVYSYASSGASYYSARVMLSPETAFGGATASFTHTAVVPEVGSLLFVTLAGCAVSLAAVLQRRSQVLKKRTRSEGT